MRCNLEAKWHMTMRCDFRCPYCFCMSAWADPGDEFSDIDRIVEGFDLLDRTCYINMTGGEPFIFPDFIELCKRLTERHYIGINTNLSSPLVHRFAQEIDPSRVLLINGSVNLRERQKRNLMDDYIEKVHLLASKGIFVTPTYVAYPSEVKDLDSVYEFFKSIGIILRIKILRASLSMLPILDRPRLRKLRRSTGMFRRKYPDSFTKEQKAAILRVVDKSIADAGVDTDYRNREWGGRFVNYEIEREVLHGSPSYRGEQCEVGREFIRIDPMGTVRTCYNNQELCLGNLYEGNVELLERPLTCQYDRCVNPYLGCRYSRDREKYKVD